MPPKRLLGDSKGSQRDALESTKSHTVDMGRGEQDLGPDLELLLVEANEVRTTLTAKSQALQKKLYTLFSNRKTTELRDAQGKLQAEGQEARYVPCTNLVVSTNLVISIGEEFKRFGEEFKRFGEEFKRFGYEFKRFGEDDAHDGVLRVGAGDNTMGAPSWYLAGTWRRSTRGSRRRRRRAASPATTTRRGLTHAPGWRSASLAPTTSAAPSAPSSSRCLLPRPWGPSLAYFQGDGWLILYWRDSQVARSSENSRTGKPIPERVIQERMTLAQRKEEEVERVRLKVRVCFVRLQKRRVPSVRTPPSPALSTGRPPVLLCATRVLTSPPSFLYGRTSRRATA
jgi:hypothetical protein